MLLDDRSIEAISQADIESLISDQVRESITIEYKSAIPDQLQQSKHRFLAQICSFANSAGGFLLFGIKEEMGLPTEVVGIGSEDVDKIVLAMEHSILNGISPRVSAVSFKAIQFENGKIVLVVRIGKSLRAPHMITLGDSNKFYARSSAGKYIMDVGQIRESFLQSEVLVEKIRGYRKKRIVAITGNDLPISLVGESRVILHIIPLDAFSFDPKFDFEKARTLNQYILPLGTDSCQNRINIDGFYSYSPGEIPNTIIAYQQLYRNGISECVSSVMIKPYDGENPGYTLIIPSLAYEKKLIVALNRYKSLCKQVGAVGPFVLAISLINVKGYIMGVDTFEIFQSVERNSIDRNDLVLPEVFLESLEKPAEQILKPQFDLIWNACGHQESLNFDKDGNWIHSR